MLKIALVLFAVTRRLISTHLLDDIYNSNIRSSLSDANFSLGFSRKGQQVMDCLCVYIGKAKVK